MVSFYTPCWEGDPVSPILECDQSRMRQVYDVLFAPAAYLNLPQRLEKPAWLIT